MQDSGIIFQLRSVDVDGWMFESARKAARGVSKAPWHISQLRNTLIPAVVVAMGLSVATIPFVFPHFKQLATREGKEEATHVARHLSHALVQEDVVVTLDLLKTFFPMAIS